MRGSGLLLLGAALCVLLPSSYSAQPAEEPRLLVIALDAVPHEIAARVTAPELGEAAAFPDFGGPTPLISTFPSTTSLALAGILESAGLERSPGYEHRFFDRTRNQKRGGGPISYRKLRFPWRRFFDWQSEGVVGKGIKLLHLHKSARKAGDRSLAAFERSESDVFHVYHDLTDLMGHVKGPDSLQVFLRYLDERLRQLRRTTDRPFYTVIYSDHGLAGGTPLRNVRRGIRKALRTDGWRRVGRLRRPNDVVLIPYGLVSSFVAFTQSGREVLLARSLATVPGVDLCAAVDGDDWLVVNATASAAIERRVSDEENLYRYRPVGGDPLRYSKLLAEASPPWEPDDWQTDAWWFQATRQAHYPDALHRIARGFDLVDNPASVLCATTDDYMYGAAYTVLGSRLSTGRLRWTHGALSRDASLGFVMSDSPGWKAPNIVRFDRALVPWTADETGYER